MGQGVIPGNDGRAEEGLVALGEEEEEEEGGEDEPPFPVDGGLVEDFVVDVGQIKGGEEG